MRKDINMKFHILTLFPEMVEQGLNTSIIGRAAAKGLLSINAVNIRDYTTEKHGKVDDYPYGGGAGMLMQAQPVYDACMAVKGDKPTRVIYMTPQGQTFTQEKAQELSQEFSSAVIMKALMKECWRKLLQTIFPSVIMC